MNRDKYLNQVIQAKNNGFPKVITGIRRCGKSYLLNVLFKDYLLRNGVKEEDILFLDMDEAKNAPLRNPMTLRDHIIHFAEEKKQIYIIIDEIQRVYPIVNPSLTGGVYRLATEKDLEKVTFIDVVLELSHKRNIDLYITGSNSKMLSSDIITEFRDKATNIEIAPFSFEEFYQNVSLPKSDAFYQYMQYGGMPLAILEPKERKKEYLKSLFETTYFKDILEHHRLKRSEDLEELCNILSTCTGELLNTEKISKTYRSIKKTNISGPTIDSIIHAFQDAFLLREARRYDVKGRREIGAQRKYFFTDVGLRNARLNFIFPDEGQLIENIVYNELIYHGYSVSVGCFDNIEKNKDNKSIRKSNEIDFYAVKNDTEYYIQVCDRFSDLTTRAREIRPYLLLRDQVQKIIVINQPMDRCKEEHGFTVIGIIEFLLDFLK